MRKLSSGAKFWIIYLVCSILFIGGLTWLSESTRHQMNDFRSSCHTKGGVTDITESKVFSTTYDCYKNGKVIE
jgi:hypothetical protein